MCEVYLIPSKETVADTSGFFAMKVISISISRSEPIIYTNYKLFSLFSIWIVNADESLAE